MRRAVGPIAAAALSAVAGLAFAPAFGGRLTAQDFAPARLVVAVLAEAIIPVAVVALCAWRRWSSAVAALAGLAALVLTIVGVVRPGSAVFSGPYRLLTTALPADADGPGVAAVAALVGMGALIAALAMYYSRAALLAIVAPLASLVPALALDAAVREPPAWYAIAIVVPAGLAVAALRSRTSVIAERDTGPVAAVRHILPAVGTVVVIGVAAVLAAVLAPALPGVRAHPADVRALVAPPLLPRTGVSPLQQYGALRNDELRVRFAGTSTQLLSYLRLVTLDHFDGQFWTTQARYRRAGHALTDDTTGGTVGVDVRAAEVGPLGWLPHPGRPVSLDATGMGVNKDTGDLAVPAGRAFPVTYRVVGRPAPVAAEHPELAGDDAQPRTGPVGTAGRAVPTEITAFARRALTAGTGYARLSTLVRQLRGPRFFVDDRPEAQGGHGYFRILSLLAGAGGIHAATSEQYASAFAVMARVLGYDARVVLGFRPRYAKGSQVAFQVGGPDIYAWAEVRFAQAGWVTFDPTPTALASLSSKTPPPSTKPPPPQGSASPTPSAKSSSPHASRKASTDTGATALTRRSTWLAWVLGLFGAAVILIGIPPTAKAGRRRRRRGRPPARAVYGAWQETLDRIVESGGRVRGGMSTGEVTRVAPQIARPYVAALAEQLDRAGYAPEPPDAGVPRLAWANANVVGTALRHDMNPRRRFLAWVDPRPLWRR